MWTNRRVSWKVISNFFFSYMLQHLQTLSELKASPNLIPSILVYEPLVCGKMNYTDIPQLSKDITVYRSTGMNGRWKRWLSSELDKSSLLQFQFNLRANEIAKLGPEVKLGRGGSSNYLPLLYRKVKEKLLYREIQRPIWPYKTYWVRRDIIYRPN